MPLLGPADPLRRTPQRVLVAGTSGSGKSTLSRRVAVALDAPYVEIDALFHGTGWVRRPEFEADVERFTAQERWVTEWQYPDVRPLLLERCDLLVWLDLPRPTVMRQLTARTVRRRLRREQLWNGNVEPPLRTFFTDPEHIVRWGWRTHHETADRVRAALETRPDLTVVRLGSHADGERWVAALG